MTVPAADLPRASRCGQCGAPLNLGDRFCPVCGAVRPGAAVRSASRRRGFWLTIGSAGALVAIVSIVAAIYFSAPERRRDQPVSHLTSGPPASLAIGDATSPRAYAGTRLGVLVSDDRGATWQPDRPTEPIVALAASIGRPAIIYIAAATLWRDDGSGPTIVQSDLGAGRIRALAVDPTTPRQVYAVGQGRALLQSQDAGQTWSILGQETPVDASSLTIGNGRSKFYVGTTDNGVFASSDGRAWVNASGFVNGALPTRAVATVVFDALSGDSYIGPGGESASGALYAGTDRGLFKSIDNGVSWSSMPFHRPTVALAVGPAGSRLMLAADSSGDVFRSVDGGASWN